VSIYSVVVISALCSLIISVISIALVRLAKKRGQATHGICLTALSLQLLIPAMVWSAAMWPAGQVQVGHVFETSHLNTPLFVAHKIVTIPVRAGALSSDNPLYQKFFGFITGLFLFLALIRLSSLCVRLRKLRSLVNTSSSPNERVLSLLNQSRLDMRRKGRLNLIIGSPDGYGSPATWGLTSPTIYLPFKSLDWEDEQLMSALRHELAHVDRADWLISIIVQATSSI
jgi:beta-lactamase regulating signal transducer with metallopeptidase domain